MQNRAIEVSVGFFFLLGLVALLVLTLKVSNLASFGGTSGYQVSGYFENIGGLKVRAPVSAGGVRIGRVSNIEYNTEYFMAKVTMTIDERYTQFPIDSAANIYTAGLLGEQYIGLIPGGDTEYLAEGSVIESTGSAVVLENLINKFLFSNSGSE